MDSLNQQNQNQNIVLFECPHCHGSIEIEQLNCGIFRHAELKTQQALNPHATQKEMEQLIQTNSIHGCGKPFRYDGKTKPEICDYL